MFRWRRSRSCNEAETKKYSWRRRSSWPASVLSAGYSTREMLSARATSATAPRWSPALKRSRCSSSSARARHRRKVLTLAPRQPTTGVS
ncbi:hypothetical protein D3C77_745060 [compost metagenome]